ncbi:hypothetical protein ACQR3P_29385 [Rhodococcus sp. IEGM1300]
MSEKNIKPRLSKKQVERHKYNMRKLETKQEKVAYIIDNFPEAKTNNNYLCMLFWRYVEGVRYMDDITRATGADSIIRNRQIVEKKRREGKTE